MFAVTGPERKRLWSAFQQDDGGAEFVVFDSDSKRVAVNVAQLAYVHFLYEVFPAPESDKMSGIDILFVGATEPEKFGIDPDPSPASDDDIGQVQLVFFTLEGPLKTDNRPLILQDEDG